MEWIDIEDRFPQTGDLIMLPGLKTEFEVRGTGLFAKGRLAVSIGLVEKYKLVTDE